MANKDCKSQTNTHKEKPHKKHSRKRKNRNKCKHKHCLRRSKDGSWHFPPDFFNHLPPPNHNLLIGSIQADTLNNCRYLLSVVDDFFAMEPEGMTADTFVGLSMLVGSVRQALRFEVEYRE